MYQEPTLSDTVGTAKQCLTFVAREVEGQSLLSGYLISPPACKRDVIHQLCCRMVDDSFDSIIADRGLEKWKVHAMYDLQHGRQSEN